MVSTAIMDDFVNLFQMELDEESERNKKPKSKMKATKDYKLLSFGDEAEEDEDVLKDVQVVCLFIIGCRGENLLATN